MPIDRTTRRKAAEHLARFMRGEITSKAYANAGAKMLRDSPTLPADDPTAAEAACTLWRLDLKAADHTVAVSRETWEHMSRVLALLESDLVECRLQTGTRRACGLGAFLIIVATAMLCSGVG